MCAYYGIYNSEACKKWDSIARRLRLQSSSNFNCWEFVRQIEFYPYERGNEVPTLHGPPGIDLSKVL